MCRFYAEISSWYDVDKEKSYCFKNKQDSNWIGVRYGSVFPFPVGRSERIIPFPTSGPLNPLPQDEREEEIFAKKRVLEQADEYFEEMKKYTDVIQKTQNYSNTTLWFLRESPHVGFKYQV